MESKMFMDYKYDYLEKINLSDVVAVDDNVWFSQTLCRVNSSIVRVGVFVEGEFPMHSHKDDDELFFVIDGCITIQTETDSFTLNKYEGVCVPKGVMHRPIVREKSVVLMVENDDVELFGSTGSE